MDIEGDEFLIPELHIQTQKWIPCLICCESLHLHFENSVLNNSDSKIDLFCQAFNLKEDSFEKGLRMSPLCTSCLELIESIGAMLKSIQDIEVKLNMKKETIIHLLRQENSSNPPNDDIPFKAFSYMQFRQDIQKKLNITPAAQVKGERSTKFWEFELDNIFPHGSESVDENVEELSVTMRTVNLPVLLNFSPSMLNDCESLNSSELAISLPVAVVSKKHEMVDADQTTRNRSIDENATDFSLSLQTTNSLADRALNANEESSNQSDCIKYSLPPGIILKDCFVLLKRLKKLTLQRKKKNKIPRLNKVTMKTVRNPNGKTEKAKRGKRRKVEVKEEAADEGEDKSGLKSKKRQVKIFADDLVRGDPCNCPEALEGKCFRRFLDPKKMRSHVRLVKSRKRNICLSCNSTFVTKNRLLKHKFAAHGMPYPFQCKEEGCSEGFVDAIRLKYHMYTHTGDFPFPCEKCGTGFPTVTRYEEHLATHLSGQDAKRFVCEICGKAFKSRKLVLMHQRYHRDEKPYQCTQCDAAFKVPSSLTSHIMFKHTKLRPFLCEDCGRSYKSKFGMERHNWFKHGGKPPGRKLTLLALTNNNLNPNDNYSHEIS